MSEEFTILKAEPPTRVGNGKPKCKIRTQIEGLQPGEALQWRPKTMHVPKAAYRAAVSVRKSHGYTLAVRKVDLGYDIYRTA